GTWLGDSNLDGRFDSTDLVQVFTVGKFETGQPAIYSEGDWNGDGQFNSNDFVTAFANGGYNNGLAGQVFVPEPQLTWCLAALLILFRRCGRTEAVYFSKTA
ncbi:MAG: hypothetical protein KDA87_23850, partial [Planctomycetales bacterium]|nr:hypothetical protein [Planctomycetales bacterium]